MGGDGAAAVVRHPIIAFQGRAYDDWLLVQDLCAAVGVGGIGWEEVAREPLGYVKDCPHAVLDRLGDVAANFERHVHEADCNLSAAYLLGRLTAYVAEERHTRGEVVAGAGAHDLPRARVYRLDRLYRGRAGRGVGEHELVDQMILSV